MEAKPITSDNQYRDALLEIERLWGSPLNTADGYRLDARVGLVEAYEEKCWAPDATARDASRESEGRSQTTG
jgi:antitoxin component HigA of HigAB toxin-antitoxin module